MFLFSTAKKISIETKWQDRMRQEKESGRERKEDREGMLGGRIIEETEKISWGMEGGR